MNARVALLALGLAVAAPVAVAGPYDQAYATIERGNRSEVRKEEPAVVTKVDGHDVRNPRRPEAVAPGPHKLTVHFDTAKGQYRPEVQEVEMTLEPCVRYRVVAVLESKVAGPWKPKFYPDPIGECRSKFLDAKH